MRKNRALQQVKALLQTDVAGVHQNGILRLLQGCNGAVAVLIVALPDVRQHGGKVGGLANITVTSLSQATSVFAGQNLGAQSYSRLRWGGWLLPAASGLLSLAGGLLMAACCRPLLLLFTQDEAVLAFAVRYIRVVLPFQWCYAAFNAIMSFANGMGEIRYSTIVNIILLWGVRIPASYLLAWLGYGGYAMAGVSLSFVVGLLAMLFYYKSHAWADICARAEAQEAA